VGKVLIIDEAYGLGSSSGGDSIDQTNQFKTAVIDTLVAEVQGVAGDDRCILLLGYRDKLDDMFQKANPGLSRRFASEYPFEFKDFCLKQLERILNLNLEDQDLRASPAAVRVALEMLDRARMRPSFSNAGEVTNLLDKAKQNYLSRLAKLPLGQRSYDGILEQEDFDPNFNRSNEKSTCRKYLEGKVANDIIDSLEEYQKLAIQAKASGDDQRELVPTRFVFKGPPGEFNNLPSVS